MPRVSVIIPNYQGENYIKACLASLLEQKFQDFCIRIVENGSTDRSRKEIGIFLSENGYVYDSSDENTRKEETDLTELWQDGSWKRFQSKSHPDIFYLGLSKNTGFCQGVNLGIRDASEEYLFLLNNDTEAEKGCIGALVSFMDRHKDAFSAGAKMVSLKEPHLADDCGDYYNALGYAFAAGKGKESSRYNKVKQVFSACGGAAVYRRQILRKIGLLDENHFAYLEDVDLGYRARIQGFINYFVPDAIVRHAGSAVSGSRHNPFKVRLSSRNSMYLIYKNQPLIQLLINLPFLFAGVVIKALFFAKKGMGSIYLKGIGSGIRFCFTKEARKHKIPFRTQNLKNYLKIQWELWINLMRMIG